MRNAANAAGGLLDTIAAYVAADATLKELIDPRRIALAGGIATVLRGFWVPNNKGTVEVPVEVPVSPPAL